MNISAISSLLHRSKEGSDSGGKGGVHESKKIEIGQNVFKQPKTIIESSPGTPRTVVYDPIILPPDFAHLHGKSCDTLGYRNGPQTLPYERI